MMGGVPLQVIHNSTHRPTASLERVGVDATWPTHAMMQALAVAVVRVPKPTAFIAAAGFEEHAAALSVLLCQFHQQQWCD